MQRVLDRVNSVPWTCYSTNWWEDILLTPGRWASHYIGKIVLKEMIKVGEHARREMGVREQYLGQDMQASVQMVITLLVTALLLVAITLGAFMTSST
jgi:hypothetical protein